MQLFYAPDITTPLYRLSEEESKHAVRVLRMELGDTIHITDGRGNLFCCAIIDAHPKRCTVEVKSSQSDYGRLPYQLTIAVAPTKSSDRYEWFLEKATEVGVERFIALESEHSERRTLKPERANKVIASAMKQSLKAFHPHFESMTRFDELISMPFSGQRFIAHCNPSLSQEGKPYLGSVIEAGADVMVLIGPEGDFSPEEVARALAAGFQEISLGAQRLRTETAALSAVIMTAMVNEMKIDNNESK